MAAPAEEAAAPTTIYTVIYQSIWRSHGDDNGYGGEARCSFMNERDAVVYCIRGNLPMWAEIVVRKRSLSPRSLWCHLAVTYRRRLKGWSEGFILKSMDRGRVDMDAFLKREPDMSLEELKDLNNYLIAASQERDNHPEMYSDFHHFDVQHTTLIS